MSGFNDYIASIDPDLERTLRLGTDESIVYVQHILTEHGLPAWPVDHHRVADILQGFDVSAFTDRDLNHCGHLKLFNPFPAAWIANERFAGELRCLRCGVFLLAAWMNAPGVAPARRTKGVCDGCRATDVFVRLGTAVHGPVLVLVQLCETCQDGEAGSTKEPASEDLDRRHDEIGVRRDSS